MSGALRVLIVGGYGTFGGRLVGLLADEAGLTLIVAGRSLAKAEASRAARPASAAEIVAAAFDRDGDLAAQLAALAPDLLVDASGPFQAYGAAPYRVAEACIAAGVNYLDLADGSEFVAGVGRLDAAAKAAGVFALAGMSTFPVLSSAVVRRLAADLARVERIRAGIAPSPYAGVGANVVRAIAGYAGKPVPLRRGGRDGVGHPFTEQLRYTVSPPGRLPLRSTLYSLVDVPDLRLAPALWPELTDIWVGAGPVPELLHRTLIACAWLVRARLLPGLAWLAPLMAWAVNTLRWGEHRGGMFVEVAGVDRAGVAVRRAWHLLAEADAGPLIPSMAAQALVRRLLAGQVPPPGARAGVEDLELADYEPLFAGQGIHAGVRDEAADEGGAPLYVRVLGLAFDELPPPIQAMHDPARSPSASGRARVERGRNPLAWLAGAVLGFPASTPDTPLRVEFAASGGVETWTRTFGRSRFASRQFAGLGRSARLLCERFGPLVFAMALVVDEGRLRLVLRRWSVFGLPLPLWLAPRPDAFEAVEDGRFSFSVEIGHPLVGLIVRYRGWLVPDAADPPVGALPADA